MYKAEGKTRARTKINKAKNKPCTDCGRRFPSYVMEFHHVRGVKLFNISHAGSSHLMAWAKVEAEMAKCVVICSNCHQIREHGDRLGR